MWKRLHLLPSASSDRSPVIRSLPKLSICTLICSFLNPSAERSTRRATLSGSSCRLFGGTKSTYMRAVVAVAMGGLGSEF